METFSILLFLLSMFAGCFFLIALIFNAIRKNPKTKLCFRRLIISVLVFIVSIILYGIFQTPETKEKYEQQRLEEAQEKAEQEAKAKAEQEAQAKAEQEALEKAEQEAQAKAEQEASENTEQDIQDPPEQETAENTEQNTESNSSNENSVKLEDVELNYFKQVGIRELPVMNGMKTERIGTYGLIEVIKELAIEVTETEYLDFCNDCVRNSGYNWFTIDFDDGTGICFTGSIPETATYGIIDDTGCVVEPIFYIDINSDNTLSFSYPPLY